MKIVAEQNEAESFIDKWIEIGWSVHYPDACECLMHFSFHCMAYSTAYSTNFAQLQPSLVNALNALGHEMQASRKCDIAKLNAKRPRSKT